MQNNEAKNQNITEMLQIMEKVLKEGYFSHMIDCMSEIKELIKQNYTIIMGKKIENYHAIVDTGAVIILRRHDSYTAQDEKIVSEQSRVICRCITDEVLSEPVI